MRFVPKDHSVSGSMLKSRCLFPFLFISGVLNLSGTDTKFQGNTMGPRKSFAVFLRTEVNLGENSVAKLPFPSSSSISASQILSAPPEIRSCN